jgi:hypothetical protein
VDNKIPWQLARRTRVGEARGMGEDGSRGAGMLTAHSDRPKQSHRPERSTAVCSDRSVGVLVLSVVDRGGGGPGATSLEGTAGLGSTLGSPTEG